MIPRWRLWLFRLIAVTVIPAAVLLTLEISLRIIGYGFPAGAVSKIKWKGQTAYCNNYRFGWRFWPPNIARESEPYTYTEKKPEDTYRIFVHGGSAALGTPEPSYSFSRVLGVMLQNQYPQINFEVINTAITAINSHVVLPVARACAPHNADLVVVYLGNNEVIGPYGAGTIFAPLSDNMTFIRFDKMMQTTRLGQLLKNAMDSKRTEKTIPRIWGGSKMFMENLIRKDDENLQVVYEHYKTNLEDITHTIRKKGTQVILCSVGSNIKDSAPFASLHRADITDDEKEKWENLYRNGEKYENSGKHDHALQSYLAAADIDSDYADLHFRIAGAYWQLGNFEKAGNEYILARETDALRLRADNRINQIIREVADNNKAKGVWFVDSVKAFEQNSPYSTIGEELFYEHVHMNFKGNYILANAVFRQVEKILPSKIKNKRADVPVLTEMQCAARLAYTDWDRYLITQKLLKSFIKKPPFTSRLYNDDLVKLLERRVQNLEKYRQEQHLKIAEEQYLEAIRNAPEDWWLYWKYARLLTEGLKKPQQGAEQYRIVTELLPNSYAAYTTHALTLLNLGKLDAAINRSSKALEINPFDVDAHHIMAIAYLGKKNTDKAMEYFANEVRIKPDRAQGYNRMGVILDQQKKTAKAEDIYREGLTFSPDDLSLHYNLAILLAKQKRFDEATENLHAALKANPNSIELLGLLNKVKEANK